MPHIGPATREKSSQVHPATLSRRRPRRITRRPSRRPSSISPASRQIRRHFNARLRDELLNGEIFYSLKEAQIIIEGWRRHYNTVRPHASLGYRAPAPDVFVPGLAAWPPALHVGAPAATLGLAKRPPMN